ncbi:MAG: FkbM family methyltransferase [Planctomycetota bacterium]
MPAGDSDARLAQAREMLAGTGYAPAPSFVEGGDVWAAQAALLRDVEVRHVLDCGANLGLVSVEYRRVFPDATIHAFEPVPETHAKLTSRLGGDDRARLVQAAITDRVGTAEITLGSAHYADSIARRPEHEGGRRGTRVEIPTTTIDRYCAQESIHRVGVLKLDVEGVELEAIRGAERILGEDRVDLIFCELNFSPRHAGAARGSAVIEALWEHGFRLFDLCLFERPDPAQGLGWCDGIFVPESRHPGFAGL